jgi:hypothetical protein
MTHHIARHTTILVAWTSHLVAKKKKKKKKKTKIESNSAYVSCNIHIYATTRLRGEET